MTSNRSIAIVTTIIDDWGGSEELWAKSIPFFKEQGIEELTVYRDQINFQHPRFIQLANQGISLKQLYPPREVIKKVLNKLVGKVAGKLGMKNLNTDIAAQNLYRHLKAKPPGLVIISQAINFDGLHLAHQCLKLQIPYVVIMQKAVDFYWPNPASREWMKQVLLGARQCFFVSQHNKILTEEQFGIRLRKSEVVFNPVKTGAALPVPFPDTQNGYRLACIGRMFIIDKGQDILLRVLAQQKWRERNIRVSFIGTGPDTEGIKEMAELLGITNVEYMGYADDIEKIWADHHALVLPSRSEGLPLVITEAMALGRTVIATNAGGNAEVVAHGINGFIGEATLKDFDEAMEQAWVRKDDWEEMGIKAAAHIKQQIPALPEQYFAQRVLEAVQTP